MADKKISQLTAATTPLAGTEIFPVVQSGTTVKATIANVQVAPVSSGTAYGVQFLNSSKTPTTSSTFQWDGANLGIGQYPSNAAGITTNIELPYGATIASRSNTAVPQLYIMSNALGTGYAPTYAVNGYATQYQMQGFDGNHYWLTAPSGTAGNAISFTTRLTLANGGDFTINTGNIIQGTAAKGINFTANTPAAGMTGQLLNWYEEGTWTPAFGEVTVTYTSQSGTYTRVGRLVFLTAKIEVSSIDNTDTSGVEISGLPFAANGVIALNWTKNFSSDPLANNTFDTSPPTAAPANSTFIQLRRVNTAASSNVGSRYVDLFNSSGEIEFTAVYYV